MRILVRKLIKTAQGGIEYQDLEIQADVLTIGRAAEQLVYLPGTEVALRHATFSPKGDNVAVAANGAAVISVNGKEERAATLKVGDAVGIGPHSLKVIKAPAGFAFALEVDESPTEEKQGVAALSGYETKLAGVGVGKRAIAWISILLVLVFGLALPLADDLSPELHKKLVELGYPAASFWSSGPLAAVHHNSKAVSDCHACHKTPFQPVANEQCIDCHKHTGNHVHPEHAAFKDAETMACGTCHEEHNEPEKLVRVEQALCVDCHGDIKQFDTTSTLENVHDFSDSHPSFKVTTFSFKDQDWLTQRVKLSDLEKESSNLKFNHKVHLNPEGISTPDGVEVLECDTCHILDESGWYMKPMTMEKTCRSCHALTFDEADPERQVPHGDPDEVATTLQEYFLRKFTEPRKVVEETEAKDLRRGRPGHEREKPFECNGLPLDCARTVTKKTMEELFERTACFTCHEVSKNEDGDGLSDYEVLPVKIASQWMTGAKFTHADHMVEDCEKCHEASKSEHSQDVMIPDIDNCRQCHGGNDSWGKLNSTCIDCHDFHFDDRGYIRPNTDIEKVVRAHQEKHAKP